MLKTPYTCNKQLNDNLTCQSIKTFKHFSFRFNFSIHSSYNKISEFDVYSQPFERAITSFWHSKTTKDDSWSLMLLGMFRPYHLVGMVSLSNRMTETCLAHDSSGQYLLLMIMITKVEHVILASSFEVVLRRYGFRCSSTFNIFFVW